MENPFKLPQDSPSKPPKKKTAKSTIDPKIQNRKIETKLSQMTQNIQAPIGGILAPQPQTSEDPNSSTISSQPQASKALTGGIILPQPQTSKASKALVSGIKSQVPDLNNFSQTVQEPQSPEEDLEDDSEIEEINGIKGDEDEDEDIIMDDNFTFQNQSAHPEPNPRHLKLYGNLHVSKILNSWFIYEKTSDYKKLMEINKKIEISNNSDDILRKDDGKLPLQEYTFHLQQVAKIVKKFQKNDQDIEAWQEWNNLMTSWDLINMNKSLPVGWKIPDNYLKIKCGISLSDLNQNNHQEQNDKVDFEDLNSESESESESDLDSELDDTPAGIRQAVQQKYSIPMLGTVLAYRKIGNFGRQCFIQYGTNEAPTYRLIPGAQAGNWDPSSVIFWPQHERGRIRDENGLKYREADIDRLQGVAWKPDPNQEREEHAMDPQSWYQQAPITVVLVLWNDGERTIESRTSMRRILGNLKGEADLMILRKAESQEKKFRRAENPLGKNLLQGPQQRKSIKAAPKSNYFQLSQKKLPAPLPAQFSQQLKELLYTMNQLTTQ